MTTTTGTTTGTTRTGTDDFVEALRAHSRRYHDQHPFHVRMNTGRLSRRQIQGWVANRFYYQENIPRKDAAILSNCPDLEVRRRWIRRIQRRRTSRSSQLDRIAASLRGMFSW
jgi:pyrroloquinoline-quinone synthase